MKLLNHKHIEAIQGIDNASCPWQDCRKTYLVVQTVQILTPSESSSCAVKVMSSATVQQIDCLANSNRLRMNICTESMAWHGYSTLGRPSSWHSNPNHHRAAPGIHNTHWLIFGLLCGPLQRKVDTFCPMHPQMAKCHSRLPWRTTLRSTKLLAWFQWCSLWLAWWTFRINHGYTNCNPQKNFHQLWQWDCSKWAAVLCGTISYLHL